MSDLEKLKDFIMEAQVASEQGEGLMPNLTDVLNEIERLQVKNTVDLGGVVQQRELLIDFCKKVEDKAGEYKYLVPSEEFIDKYLEGKTK